MALDLATAIADDPDIFDGLEAASLTHRLTGNVSSGNVLFRAIDAAEAAASDGRYTMDDVRVHFKLSDVSETPKPADTVTDAGGQVWTVLAVQKATIGTRWRLICRILDVANETDTLISIEQAGWAKSAGGAQVATWSPWQTDVRAKIQRLDSMEGEEDNLRQVRDQFVVFCEVQNLVGASHRIVGADGTIYRIKGYRKADQIGALYEIVCELW